MKRQKRTLLVVLTMVMLCALLSFVASCGGCAGCATAEKTSLLKFKSDGKNYDIVVVNSSDNLIEMPENPEKIGYNFDGWFFDENKWENPLKTDTKIEKDAEVFAKWSLVDFAIAYDLSGGAYTDNETNPAQYTIESADITLKHPKRNGYAFDGWYLGETRVQTIKTGSTGNIKLTAKWVKDGYSITYLNTKGAENDNPLTYVISENAVALKDIKKDGYSFDGWFDGDKKITEIPANSTGDITLTAKWSLVKYSVLYKDRDGKVLDTQGYDLPTEYTIESEDIALGDFYKEGYRFDGWLNEKGFRISFIPAGSTGDITIIADLVPDTEFKINLIDGMFGKKNDDNPTYYIVGEPSPELKPLSRIDYDFLGWSNGIEYVDEIDTSIGGDITLYAMWEQKAELKNFEYIVDESYTWYNKLGFLMILGTNGTSGREQEKIVIPDYVSMISRGALKYCANVKELTLPFVGKDKDDERNTLSYLFSESLDADNSSVPATLSSVTITSGNVPNYALKDCKNITKIVFTEDVQSIGKGVLQGCAALEELEVPFVGSRYDESDAYNSSEHGENRLNYIFDGELKSLKKLKIAKGYISGDEYDVRMRLYYGSNNVFEELDYTSTNETLVKGIFEPFSQAKQITVRGNVKTVEQLLARGKRTVDIILPETVTTLAENALKGLNNLRSVTLPNIESIGANAFEGCGILDDVVLGEKLTEIGAGAFANCENLFKITIPENVTSIGENAFAGCTNLIEVFNYSALTAAIGSDDLGGLCKYALAVHTVKGEKSFIENVNDLLIFKKTDGDLVIKYTGSAENVVIPDGVKIIMKDAFFNNSFVKSVLIPNGVTSIESGAFRSCNNLVSVEMPDSVIAMGDKAFLSCPSLNSINLSAKLTGIGAQTFEGCISLTNLSIPASVTFVGERAFANSGVTEIILPKGLLSIEKETFASSKIVSVSIPDGVLTIGESAFEDCAYLAEITLPNGLTNIKNRAFYGCGKLNAIKIPSTVTNIGNYAFYSCAFVSVEVPEGVTSLNEGVFNSCLSLETVKLPNTITSIGMFAFSGCTAVSALSIPESIKEINVQAFSYSKIKKLAINGQPTSLNRSILYGAEVETLKLPFIGSSLGEEKTLDYFFSLDGKKGGDTSALKTLIVEGGRITRENFPSYYSVTAVIFGKNVTSIADAALHNFGELKTLVAPNVGIITDSSGNSMGLLKYFFVGLGNTYQEAISIFRQITTVGVFDGDIPTTFYNSNDDKVHISTMFLPKNATSLDAYMLTSNSKIFYKGSEAEWESVTITNLYDTTRVVYYYSETNPYENSTASSTAKYWHYSDEFYTCEIWQEASE